MTGKTPFEYLNNYRVEQAGELLLSTDMTVAKIAGNCGFNDASYFSKIFSGTKVKRRTTIAKNIKPYK